MTLASSLRNGLGLLAIFALTAASEAAELPKTVKEALNTALQDEFHAEAFYAAVISRHGEIRPFSNVIKAERHHASMLRDIMVSHGIHSDDNPMLADSGLAATVPDTVREACDLSVKAEIDNAALYDEKLIPAASGHADILAVFEILRDASRLRHLPAFQRCGGR